MKTRSLISNIRTAVLLAHVFLGFIASGALAGDDPMLWTSDDGVTIRARLAGTDGGHVFLVAGGRYCEVPLEVLSPECVAKAKRLLASDAEAEPTVDVRSMIPAPASLPARACGTTPTDRHGMPVYPYHVRTRVVRTTAYSCGESDHLIYGNRNALGTSLKYGAGLCSAAADWSVYPAGTTFRITGLPWLYVVDDYGSALVGTGTIDIYHPGREEMKRWGRRNVEVTIVRWGSLGQSARILAGRTRHDHCRQMFDAINRQCAVMRLVASR